MSRCFLCIALSLLFSLHGYANGTQVFILGVQAEGDLVQKALEIDKMVCLAGAAVAKKKKQAALCAHELNAMLQHYAMTQSLVLKLLRLFEAPSITFKMLVFSVPLLRKEKTSTVSRFLYCVCNMKGGTPPALVKETTIALAQLPKDHELVFLEI